MPSILGNNNDGSSLYNEQNLKEISSKINQPFDNSEILNRINQLPLQTINDVFANYLFCGIPLDNIG